MFHRFLVGQYVTVDDDVVSHVNISGIKEEDGGEYTCTAKNAVDKISHSARINVYGIYSILTTLFNNSCYNFKC